MEGTAKAPDASLPSTQFLSRARLDLQYSCSTGISVQISVKKYVLGIFLGSPTFFPSSDVFWYKLFLIYVVLT